MPRAGVGEYRPAAGVVAPVGLSGAGWDLVLIGHDADLLDVVASEVEDLEALEALQADESVDLVLVNPQFLEVNALFEAASLGDAVEAEVQLA